MSIEVCKHAVVVKLLPDGGINPNFAGIARGSTFMAAEDIAIGFAMGMMKASAETASASKKIRADEILILSSDNAIEQLNNKK